ncbi:hypothetical protein [Arcicella rigui]|uniref:Uncharacterized protein n=1 Tax=Arcicella rigui TaxID=797020 RepID=A0ABU5QGC2_9BACT|nr:hypothetical protein [Arcicella rigui]MEA5141803.1 hypothetical protein [Arcicella rigui]
MSNNLLNIDKLSKEINSLSLSDKMNKGGYSDLFYEHLTGLTKFKMLSESYNLEQLKLNEKTYLGLEQFAIEHSETVEGEKSQNDIDWDLIDDAKEILQKKLANVLNISQNYESSGLKPIVKATIDNYENFLIYKMLYPNSFSNPWIPTNSIILENGYLVMVSGEKELIKEYDSKILEKVEEDSTELFLVAKSKSTRGFSGFPIDTRNNTQSMIFDFLKLNASGMSSAIKTEKIAKYLSSRGKNYNEQEVRVMFLLPLKRAGLIGSSTNGYFYINSKEDLIHSYKHHREKLRGIQKTLDMYKNKGRLLGIDLESE